MNEHSAVSNQRSAKPSASSELDAVKTTGFDFADC
jgi:hypothetical protein